MGGIFAVLMQHHNIRNGKAVPFEVLRAVEIEGFVNAFQLHHGAAVLRQCAGVDFFIIVRVYEKPETLQPFQRLEAVVMQLLAGFELIDSKGALFRHFFRGAHLGLLLIYISHRLLLSILILTGRQLDFVVHILVARIGQHHHSVIEDAFFLAEQTFHLNAPVF